MPRLIDTPLARWSRTFSRQLITAKPGRRLLHPRTRKAFAVTRTSSRRTWLSLIFFFSAPSSDFGFRLMAEKAGRNLRATIFLPLPYAIWRFNRATTNLFWRPTAVGFGLLMTSHRYAR